MWYNLFFWVIIWQCRITWHISGTPALLTNHLRLVVSIPILRINETDSWLVMSIDWSLTHTFFSFRNKEVVVCRFLPIDIIAVIRVVRVIQLDCLHFLLLVVPSSRRWHLGLHSRYKRYLTAWVIAVTVFILSTPILVLLLQFVHFLKYLALILYSFALYILCSRWWLYKRYLVVLLVLMVHWRLLLSEIAITIISM
jgi:hypothetical protein